MFHISFQGLAKPSLSFVYDPYNHLVYHKFEILRLSAFRYFYPFPVGPWLYQVELSIGGQQFHGKGRTRQAAKHDAAAKALKILQNEPLPEKPEVVCLECFLAPFEIHISALAFPESKNIV